MNRHNDLYILFLCFLFTALVIFFVNGCSSTEHRREQLQLEHPECYVFENLNIECPDPFVERSSGFGISVETKKIKPKTKVEK